MVCVPCPISARGAIRVTPEPSMSTKGESAVSPAPGRSGFGAGAWRYQTPSATPPAMAAEPKRKPRRAMVPALATAQPSEPAAERIAARMRG